MMKFNVFKRNLNHLKNRCQKLKSLKTWSMVGPKKFSRKWIKSSIFKILIITILIILTPLNNSKLWKKCLNQLHMSSRINLKEFYEKKELMINTFSHENLTMNMCHKNIRKRIFEYDPNQVKVRLKNKRSSSTMSLEVWMINSTIKRLLKWKLKSNENKLRRRRRR